MCKQLKCKPWIVISIVTITLLFAILVTTVTILLTHNNYKPKRPKPRKKIIPKKLNIFDEDWLVKALIKTRNTSSKIIFPGTRWCGEDDIAKSIHELGQFQEEDKCCRKHDKCPEIIPRDNINKFGLENIGVRIALHCDCDKELYQCFKRIDSPISRIIGRLYFNLLGKKCFKKDFPIIECTKWDDNYTLFNFFSVSRCTEYKLNTTQGKKYQWFDNPIF